MPSPVLAVAIVVVVVLAGSWLLRPRPVAWKAFLVVAAYGLYGWLGSWWFGLVLAGLTLVAQVAAHAVAGATGPARRGVLAVAAVATGGLVLWLHLTDSIRSIDAAYDADTVLAVEVLVPFGITLSAVTAFGYVLDVYRGVARPATLLDAAVLVSFLPRLLAGPPVRAGDVVPQLHAPADPRRIEAGRAVRLLVSGFAKAFVIAPFLSARVVTPVLAAPGDHGGVEVLVVAYAVVAQLYAELSGVADLAVGAALLLGVRLPDAFHRPLLASSLQAFWRAWYTPVTQWWRDVTYVPLGGAKLPELASALAVLGSSVLAGVLLGPSGGTLAFGVVAGVLTAGERLVRGDPADRPATPLTRLLGWFVTVNLVALMFLVLRAGSVGALGDLAGSLGSSGPAPSVVTPLAVGVIALVVAAQAVPARVLRAVDTTWARAPLLVQAGTLAASLVALAWLAPTEFTPPWYLRF